ASMVKLGMNMKVIRFFLSTTALLGVLVLVGCVTPQDSKPVVINKPVDALNAVERPHTPSGSRHGGSLSSDVERLQDAHRLYQNERARRHEKREESVDRSQQHCLQQGDSRRVPIEGGGAGAVYCEPAP